MAVDIFIKIGDIKGESQDKAHKDEIDVLNWSAGAADIAVAGAVPQALAPAQGADLADRRRAGRGAGGASGGVSEYVAVQP